MNLDSIDQNFVAAIAIRATNTVAPSVFDDECEAGRSADSLLDSVGRAGGVTIARGYKLGQVG